MKRLQIVTSIIIYCLLLVVSIYRCDSGPKMSTTEKARMRADPRAVQFLIQAEESYRQKAYVHAMYLSDSAEYFAPELADIAYLRAQLYKEVKRFKQSKAEFEKVLKIDPYYHGAWEGLGTLLLFDEKFDEALEMFKKEQKLANTASINVKIGRVHDMVDRVDEAEKYFLVAVEMNENFAPAYLRLGQLYKKTGDLEKALFYTQKGYQLQPEDLDTEHLLGSLLVLQGKAEEALPKLLDVVKKRPWHYWANYNLGQAYVRLRQKEKADHYLAVAESLQVELKNIQDWEALAESNPDQFMLWVNLGEAYRRTGRFEEAAQAYNLALTLEPRATSVRINMANAFVMAGDTLSAIKNYKYVLDKHIMHVDAWENLGILYASLGQKSQAKSAWQNALKYEPSRERIKKYLQSLGKN